MKKNWMLAIVCALFIPALVMAQPGLAKGRTVEERAQRQTEQMSKKLGLDENQTVLVGEINLKYAKQVDEILASDQEQPVKRAAIRDLRTAQDEDLRQVLTEDQYLMLSTAKDARQEKAKSMKAKAKAKGQGKKPKEKG